MEIKVYKTYEIPEALWEPIAEGFRESFDSDISAERLKNYCYRNPFHYCFHAIAFAENGIVAGYNVFTPTLYENNLKVVVSGSTYVRKEFRKEAFLFMNMMQALRKTVIEDGFQVEVGVPNHNSRKFAAKVLGLKYVGDLDYYLLPMHISKVVNKHKLSIVDHISSAVCQIHLYFQAIISSIFNFKEKIVKYRLEQTDEYRKARFKGPYTHNKNGKYESYYRVVDEDGTKTIYLMDFCENGIRTSKSLNVTTREIVRKESPDAILFVGTMRMIQFSLCKVPTKFVPKPLPLTYYVLNKEDKDTFSDMQDLDNWNFSLMNFDAR